MGTKIRSARMTNIRRHLPETYLFTTHLPVRVTDLNYGNHLGNDAFVACRHEARARWLHQYTWTELDMNGSGLIMVELAVRCSKAAAEFGNTLRIKLAVQEWLPADSRSCTTDRHTSTVVSSWPNSVSLITAGRSFPPPASRCNRSPKHVVRGRPGPRCRADYHRASRTDFGAPREDPALPGSSVIRAENF